MTPAYDSATPRPLWVFGDMRQGEVQIEDTESGEIVCTVHEMLDTEEPRKAGPRARLIVEAVNSFDSLQARVERLEKALESSVKAFEAFHAGFRDKSILWAKKRVSDSDPYHPANTAMCQAEEEARAALGGGK